MKICFKCTTILPLSEFYKHPQMRDGHLNKCKECTKKDTHKNAAYKMSHDLVFVLEERKRQRDKSRKAIEAGKAAKKSKHAGFLWEIRNPHKKRATSIVNSAIKSGRLVKQPCEVCGETKVDAHHHDYSKPLDVRWLCRKHHAEEHVRINEMKLIQQFATQ